MRFSYLRISQPLLNHEEVFLFGFIGKRATSESGSPTAQRIANFLEHKSTQK